MSGPRFKVVPWRRAAKYTRRAIFLRRESTGEYLRVASIVKRGPNLWVALADGRTFLVDRERRFYGRTFLVDRERRFYGHASEEKS